MGRENRGILPRRVEGGKWDRADCRFRSPPPCLRGYDAGMEPKRKPIDSWLETIAIYAVGAVVTAGLFFPEIVIGGGVILGIIGWLNYIHDPRYTNRPPDPP